jgi:hypothetical protein
VDYRLIYKPHKSRFTLIIYKGGIIKKTRRGRKDTYCLCSDESDHTTTRYIARRPPTVKLTSPGRSVPVRRPAACSRLPPSTTPPAQFPSTQETWNHAISICICISHLPPPEFLNPETPSLLIPDPREAPRQAPRPSSSSLPDPRPPRQKTLLWGTQLPPQPSRPYAPR